MVNSRVMPRVGVLVNNEIVATLVSEITPRNVSLSFVERRSLRKDFRTIVIYLFAVKYASYHSDMFFSLRYLGIG